MTDPPVNSQAFWEGYFVSEWSTNDGPGQSRHFMLQLLAHLPASELSWLTASSVSILDWGCATGEGTCVLARAFPASGVNGLDFAKQAIDTAIERHPDATFLWDPEGKITEQFDVIVTSNCLEHFEDPLKVAAEHVQRCRYLYLALVPYREHPLHEQHFAQFRDESFPEVLGSFSRIAVRPFTVDNPYWPGEQVLAVYGSAEYLQHRPAVEDSAPPIATTSALLAETVRLSGEVANVSADVRAHAEANATLISDLKHSAGKLEQAQADLEKTEAELAREHARVHELEQTERDVRGVLSARIHELEQSERDARDDLSQVADQLGQNTRLLLREETSVLRPILRRIWRTARAVARQAPPQWQDNTRAFLAPFVSRLAPNSAQATFYKMARQRRTYDRRPLDTGAIGGATVGPRDPDAFWATYQDPGARLTFFVFPVIDWHFRFQRPQQLAKALGERGHNVFYISPDFLPETSGRPFEILGSPCDNVQLCRLACPSPHPRIYETLPSPAQADALARNLAVMEATHGGGAPIRLVQHPFWTPLMRQWDVGLLVYDLMDEHAGFIGNGAWLRDQEEDLLSIADLVTVTSETLANRVEPSKLLVLKNAADLKHFERVKPRESGSTPVRVGYYGAIAHWFDSALVRDCAKAHPEWEFELVGSTLQADLLGLDELPNVVLHGEKDYNAIVEYLSRWDVALIPFKNLPLTRATNPVKVYEYLSAGKPVVATKLPELSLPPVRDWVRVASGSTEFIAAVESAVGDARDPFLAKARKEAVRDESWGKRAELLERAVAERFPFVSVVIVCYGQLALTKDCVRSLLSWSGYPNWQLVAVDNASPDGTGQWLEEVCSLTERVLLVSNDENRGFAAGVNVGVRHARGDYIIVMNNDTQVTPGWLLKLVRHLRNDVELGLVGAVTNAIGNEAAIDIVYSNEWDMLEAAQLYASKQFRVLLPVERVAFFAVGFTKTTWDLVGELDEGYGLGYFEDDDYCIRVLRAGLRISIAEDAFVHHELSASFDALGREGKRRQFESSRSLFEEKWGPWTPHQYRQRTR